MTRCIGLTFLALTACAQRGNQAADTMKVSARAIAPEATPAPLPARATPPAAAVPTATTPATPPLRTPPEPRPVPMSIAPKVSMALLDTIRGVPAIVGTEHDKRVSLRTSGGTLRLVG